MSNLYNVLEVHHKASYDVIKAAYRALVRIHNGDDKKMVLLNEANEILCNEVKRASYDKKKDAVKKGKVVGNYRILEMIAEGGFGKTYKAEQITTNCPVCIKHANEISAQDEEILLEEAKAIWDMRHYGIPAMRDVFKIEDSLALVMSYVPGRNLAQIIEVVKRLDPEDVAWITERVLNILLYLHTNGVCHGDVKPQNIIIQEDSHQVVLVDYGLSSIRPSSKTVSKGYTPFFAAPEQMIGGPILPETDFYGLGITMIYALGGDIETKKVPGSVPDPLCEFVKRLIKIEVLSRPNWEKENLCSTIQDVRMKVFGRRSTNMKPLKV
jgi:serine/threonine protein kinase